MERSLSEDHEICMFVRFCKYVLLLQVLHINSLGRIKFGAPVAVD